LQSSTAEDDGSHAVEMADGSVAIIPADQVPAIVQVFVWLNVCLRKASNLSILPNPRLLYANFI
jgi:hypothetical protein